MNTADCGPNVPSGCARDPNAAAALKTFAAEFGFAAQDPVRALVDAMDGYCADPSVEGRRSLLELAAATVGSTGEAYATLRSTTLAILDKASLPPADRVEGLRVAAPGRRA